MGTKVYRSTVECTRDVSRRSLLSSFGPAEIQIIKSRANSQKAIPIQNTGNKDGRKDNCDLNLQDSKAVFLHDTLVHDDVSPY